MREHYKSMDLKGLPNVNEKIGAHDMFMDFLKLNPKLLTSYRLFLFTRDFIKQM